MVDVLEGLAGAGASRLQEAVRAALGEPGAVLARWDAVPLNARACSLYLLRGTARVSMADHPWCLVLKVLAPPTGHDDPTDIVYWKREPLLYGSGLLDALPDGMGAPRCFGCDEPADGTVWLWLEHIRDEAERIWPTERWAHVARHLGRLGGTYLTTRTLPRASWLGGRRLRTWLARHGPLVAQIAAAPNDPDVRRWWPRSVVDAILRLWEERDAFCSALERLPPTFGHGDAIRRNLLVRRRADGTTETVGIDWEHAGHYAPGEDVGQTLSVAAAFFDAEPADLPALDEALFGGYLAGLRDAGWDGDPRPVRFAYAAHAALRNGFNAVGARVPDEARRAAALQTYGHTWEDLAERRAAVRPFLLARAAEARRLLDTL